MRLRLVREPFDHPDYIFELKHDGFSGDRVPLTRRVEAGADVTIIQGIAEPNNSVNL